MLIRVRQSAILTFLFGVMLMLSVPSTAQSASTPSGLSVQLVPINDLNRGYYPLEGYLTTDITIDRWEEWAGSQLLLTLSQGTLYRDAFGAADGSGRVLDALFGHFPSWEFNTYYTAGHGSGGAVDLGGDPTAFFPQRDGNGSPAAPLTLNQAWTSSFSNRGPDQSLAYGTITARISLSTDAQGEFSYLAENHDGVQTIVRGRIIDGVLIPEPTTFIGFCIVIGSLTTRRQRGSRLNDRDLPKSCKT